MEKQRASVLLTAQTERLEVDLASVLELVRNLQRSHSLRTMRTWLDEGLDEDVVDSEDCVEEDCDEVCDVAASEWSGEGSSIWRPAHSDSERLRAALQDSEKEV